MNVKPINSEEDYQKALERFNEVFHAPQGTPDGDEAQLWSIIIGDYEDKHYPIDPIDPIDMIKYKMEELNLKQVDLIDAFGGKNRASEVLNRKRRLTIEMIRKLSEQLGIPAKVLIADYDIYKVVENEPTKVGEAQVKMKP